MSYASSVIPSLDHVERDLSGRIDDGNTGTAWQNQDIRELNHRNVATLDASWSLFKDGLFGGDDSHSFKFGAALQAAQGGEAPVIVRIESSAGHGAGKSLAMIAAEWADLLAFAAHHTGLTVPAAT